MRYLGRNRRSLGRNTSFGAAMTALALVHSAPALAQEAAPAGSIEAADADTLRVTGDLTIKDVTKPVTIDFEFNGAATDPYGNQRIGFEGSTTIVRSEFGITFNAALETGGVLVSDKIQLELEVSAIKQA